MGYMMGQTSMAEYLTYLSKIDKARDIGLWNFVHRVQHAKVLAEINAQRPPVAQWLNWAYGPDIPQDRIDHRRTSLSCYLYDFLRIPPKIKLHFRNMTLCGCALDDYKVRLWQGKSLPNEYFSEKMNVNAKNFSRDWKAKLDICLENIKLLDNEGVIKVSVVVKEIRDSEEN